MTKSFVAYFKSENDAETAKAKLEKLRVSNVLVDELPETKKHNAYFPIVGMGTPGTMSTGTGVMGLGVADVSDNNREEHGQITHLLEGKVEEEDYDQAISILAESKGYKNE
ncbi:hypothetical protein BN988_03078 [Oceanobacillus picturae]|uniref:Uncharacterized protein n=1 Tax=Oceanobacillus picturae TaxID=171693 RepID=W9AGB5_9BACI|nr:hypothetical protein [Oceanobacillus picturae]CDO04518.1 hypothetical protein BN988_03078 [Oceanobacillus picturae]